MHVIAHVFEVATARTIDDQRLVAAGEKVSEQLVPPVEAAGVSAQQPFHPGDQIGPGCLDHQMKMVRHEDIGVKLPARLGASLGERLDETPAIPLVARRSAHAGRRDS